MLHFVIPETFKNVLKNIKDVVLESVAENILIYKKEIVNLLVLMLPRLAERFCTQRGKIFGYGPEAQSDLVTFKIVTATAEELEKLNKTSVYSLSEERSVGSVNYELGICGKRNLEPPLRSFSSINLLVYWRRQVSSLNIGLTRRPRRTSKP